jgi:hypothetical protein
VKLDILDLSGKVVQTIASSEHDAGHHVIRWQPPQETATGVYFYRIEAIPVADPHRRYVETKRLVFLK